MTLNTRPFIVETPFNFRYSCWFCGEPAAVTFTFPNAKQVIAACVHPCLTLNTCSECQRFASLSSGHNIWQVNQQVKKQLMAAYRKDLAIGLNWTKTELANAGFEGGNFESFQKSAWFMYEIAKQRVNFKSWPLVINGLTLAVKQTKSTFKFDGIEYPHIDSAIDQYANNFHLNKAFFREVITCLGEANFAQAVRFCRLLVGSTPAERQQALKELLFKNN